MFPARTQTAPRRQPPAGGSQIASYLRKAPVLKSLAGVSKESCVSLDMGSHQFQKQGTFRNETESNPVIQTGPPGPALGFGSPQPRESWDSASSPSCFSSERIQRKLQLGSLELTAWALLFLFFFFFSEYLLSFLTCSLSPSAGNYSVSLSPDSQRLHYIIQTVPFEL